MLLEKLKTKIGQNPIIKTTVNSLICFSHENLKDTYQKLNWTPLPGLETVGCNAHFSDQRKLSLHFNNFQKLSMTHINIYTMRMIKQVDFNEQNVHEGEETTVTKGMQNERDPKEGREGG